MEQLLDEAWALMEPLLPSSAGCRGGQWRDHRKVLEAVLWGQHRSAVLAVLDCLDQRGQLALRARLSRTSASPTVYHCQILDHEDAGMNGHNRRPNLRPSWTTKLGAGGPPHRRHRRL